MELIIQHTVRDFDAWKSAFDEHEPVRARHGCLGHTLYRGGEGGNEVTAITSWESRDGAEAFAADPSLREAMERGGVVGEPRVQWVDAVETVAYSARRVA
jgi:heme-degrading monooxygenase HmoA